MVAPKPRVLTVGFPQERVQRLQELIKLSQLPERAPIPDVGWQLGVELDWLKDAENYFANDFSWDDLAARINRWSQFMVKFPDEDVDLHFVHVRSDDENAIPLMLLHGWPGSFHDFYKIIEPLTKPTVPGVPAFHVIIPSLPGYFLSTSPARAEWTIVDTARLLNKLMVEVLQYERYVCQGGDWGSFILRILISLPDTSPHVPLAHFNMFRGPLVGSAYYLSLLKSVPLLDYIPGYRFLRTQLEERGLFTAGERRGMQRGAQFVGTGRGYVVLQDSKPLTIGYALNDSPLGLLAYIGEKMHDWSDVSAPKFDMRDIVENVALYWLSGCFHTSVLYYNRNAALRDSLAVHGKWLANPHCLIGYTVFPHEIGVSPRSTVSHIGKLVFYREKEQGGHFPALDNPSELAKDLRDFVTLNWTEPSRGG